MGLYRKITSLFLPSKTTDPLTEEEKNLRWQWLQQDMGEFVFEEDGFRYPFKERDEKLKYSDIDRISGYKLDLMTTDEICMDIFVGEWKITFSESDRGWYQLQTRLKTAFPSIPDNWDVQIMQPPFATTFTVLYEREAPDAGN